MQLSKSKIDKAGRVLAKEIYRDEIEYIESEDVLDEYRKGHLFPLTETTLELQEWLSTYSERYYIAQRLKRKPQIIRKMRRLSVRLTQLQDIGGARIIVDTNKDVDDLRQYLVDKISEQEKMLLIRESDYRQRGRFDTGYRALHLVLQRYGYKLELQIRSRIQHYWAESVERASVIYGYALKEQEGDKSVLRYFKALSDALYVVEMGRDLTTKQKLDLETLRQKAESIIQESDKHRIFDSYVNEGIIRTLSSVERGRRQQFNNWIIIFDWNQGMFVAWDIVDRDPDRAIDAYVQKENQFPAEKGYEVVLVGASDVATIRQTHSHYFGIGSAEALEGLEQSIAILSQKMDIDVGARHILDTLHRRHFWGNNTIRVDTLKNHLCKSVITFDDSYKSLKEKGLITETSRGIVSLNLGKKKEIEKYL